MTTHNVQVLRQGEHAWSISIRIGSEVIRLYDSPDSWLATAAEAEYERARITRLLDKLRDDR